VASLAEWWYNINCYTSIRTTPCETLYGQATPFHSPYFPRDSNVATVDEYLTNIEDMLRALKKNLQTAQHRMTQLANKKRSERTFNAGDWVSSNCSLTGIIPWFKGPPTN